MYQALVFCPENEYTLISGTCFSRERGRIRALFPRGFLPLSLSLSLSLSPSFTHLRGGDARTHGEDGGTTAAVEWPRRAGATVGMG